MDNNASHIKLEAAQWIVKYNIKSLSNKPEFIAWLNTSPEHKHTFETLTLNWQALEKIERNNLNNSAKNIQNITAISFNNQTKKINKSFKKFSYFALVASIFLFSFIYFNHDAQSFSHVYKTPTAKQANYILPDGSTLWLNAKSEVSIHFSQNKRQIAIIKGDAHFKVSKDKKRPFIVSYGEHRFTALGTAFTVNTRPYVQLAVTEHKVKLSYRHTNKIIREGYTSEFNDRWQMAKVTQSQENWTDTKLNFKGRPLKDVLTQIQPYVSEKIKLVDRTQANELISGSVNLKKPHQALKLITSGLDLKITFKNNEIKIF
ncbi:FecR family protein [Pseudoalteromonas denitrificans]|uniref:FecR family protein n=1 Tax=Pseudoalteromonas denitrificans DSM 6059 TaxID=1123010 RepID=A0A1I1IHT8_9GAMM|nr:FecR domain-containing protein [Pseudoalteromonas denitrificans]SFC32790.1 FecR family protein [Pseudoalteromonas denitrificans DSM 6059]